MTPSEATAAPAPAPAGTQPTGRAPAGEPLAYPVAATGRRFDRRGAWPVVLCWLAIALDGFDLVVLGAVIPVLESTRALGFTNASLTWTATAGLVGVGIGAIAIGPVTDRYGRRRALIACVSGFSVATLLIAWAPSIATFTALRFLAGIGLGACLPTALAFMSEYAPPGRRGSAMTRMMTGYHVGAVTTALLALIVVPHWGWRAMFALGGGLGLLVVPLLVAKLPESVAFVDRDRRPAPVPVATIVTGHYRRASLALWVASFCGLLLVYGLNTWLPKIMGAAGYSIDASIGLLLTLNLGAVAGLTVAGRLADTRGNKRMTLGYFAGAAVFLALLSIKMPFPPLVYASVFVAGAFVFSAQVLVNAFVGHLYPPRLRGTALGMCAGVGRAGAISGPYLGGALVTAGLAYPWGFYAFAGTAVLAIGAISVVPERLPDHDHASN